MPMVFLRSMVTSRPGWVVAFWVAAAGASGFFAPDLDETRGRGSGELAGAGCREPAPRARRCAGRGPTRRMSRSWSPPFTAPAG